MNKQEEFWKDTLEQLPPAEPNPEYRAQLRQQVREAYTGHSFSDTTRRRAPRKRSVLPWAMTAAAAILFMVFSIPTQNTYAHIETSKGVSLAQQGNSWVKLANNSAVSQPINKFYIPTGSQSNIVLPEFGNFTAQNDCRIDFNANNKTIYVDGGILEATCDDDVTIIVKGSKQIKVNGKVRVNLCIPGGLVALLNGKAYVSSDGKNFRPVKGRASLSLKHNNTISPQTAEQLFSKLKDGDNISTLISSDISSASKFNVRDRLVLARRLADKRSLNNLLFSLPQLKALKLDEQYEVLRLINSYPMKEVITAQRRAYFGMMVHEIEPGLKKMFQNHYGVENGLIIKKVGPRSPASEAGLKRYDIITALGGEKLNRRSDLFKLLDNYRPEDTVLIEYNRRGKKRQTEVTMGNAPYNIKKSHLDMQQLQKELEKQILAKDDGDKTQYMKRLQELLNKMSAAPSKTK